MPYILQIGKPYIQGRTEWPEGQEYQYTSDGHTIRFFFRDISTKELKAFQQGKITFAVNTEASPDVLFLLYRIDSIIAGEPPPFDWSDTPFSMHVLPEDYKVTEVPDIGTTEAATVIVLLIDADTGILTHMSLQTFPHNVSAALHDALRYQISHPITRQQYDAEVNRIMEQYPTTSDLLKTAIR